jgi:class III poly(R)-hydroxyalkanoic acid synthase PhaE subunit
MQGFGAGGMGGASGDFNEAAKQVWSAWGDMMRGVGTPASAPAAPPWNDPVAWWAQMTGAARPEPPNPAEDLLHRFREQAGGWFGQMQQLASQFAGRNASAEEIASAWKQALGGNAASAFTDVFATMSRPGQQGMESWIAQMRPMLGFMQSMQSGQPDARAWMGLPAFGFTREHQERWQQIALAQIEHQEKNRAFAELMAEAARRAFTKFEEKLAARSEPGKQIESTRALFDLWIDAAEDAYAEIALSERFREVYGALVDAQMRLRAAVQREVEQFGQLLGTPTRTEVDAAHRKIVQLERELRRMRDAITALQDRAETQAAPGARAGTPPSSRGGATKTSAPADETGEARSPAVPKRAAAKRENNGQPETKPARTKQAAAKPRIAGRELKSAPPATKSRKPRR